MSATLSEQDILYLPSHWSKRMHYSKIVEAHFEVLRKESEAAVERFRPDIVPYGESETNELVYYWFSPAASGAADSQSLLVYIHGGYWQTPELTARMSSSMAPTFVESGVHFVSIGYDCAPRLTIEATVQAVKTGLQACLERALQLGVKSAYISGHSAGGHLTLAAGACVRWPSELARLIKGYLPISGVFDLIPLVKTCVNDALGMNTARAAALSPMRGLREHLLGPDASTAPPIRAIVGALESPEFHRQSRELCDILREHRRPADLNVIPERDHFDIIERLSDQSDPLACLILEFIQSGGTLVNDAE